MTSKADEFKKQAEESQKRQRVVQTHSIKALARGDCALAEDGCCRRSRNEGFLDQKASWLSLAFRQLLANAAIAASRVGS